MNSDNPLDPHVGEAPMSLEIGLIVLAIGAIIFAYLIWKLVAEYRVRKAQRDQDEST